MATGRRRWSTAAAAGYPSALSHLDDPAARWIDRHDSALPFTGFVRRPESVPNPPHQAPRGAIVTTGLAVDPAALSASENVTVVATAPHRPVMEHAALVVTHGGHGTVMKALAAGLPLTASAHRSAVTRAAAP